MDREDYWLYTKFKSEIQLMSFSDEIFIQNICKKFNLTNDYNPEYNERLNWSQIVPRFSFPFNYLNNEESVASFFYQSELRKFEYVFIEALYNLPVFKIKTTVFMKNWYELIEGNVAMGCIVTSDNYDLLMEFTDDADSLLISNFQIKA